MAQPARFEEFVAKHGNDLLKFAYLLSNDRGRAQDLTQEALYKLHRRWADTAEPIEAPVAYARRIVTTEYLGWRRRLPSREVVGFDAPSEPSEPSMEARIVDRQALWKLMTELSRRQRTVLVLRYFEDRDDDEIGRILGCARGTVRSLASRALATLRDRAYEQIDAEISESRNLHGRP